MGDFWLGFNDNSLYTLQEDKEESGLAQRVLQYYGIVCDSSIGGSLQGIDIKQMDAISVIRMSLLEQSALDNTIYELIIDEEGEAQAIEIGEFDGEVTEIYNTIQTNTYVEECKGVIVRGGTPLPTRKTLEWKPIWGLGFKYIFDTELMANNCKLPNFSQYASIVFKDPNLTNGESGYEDGISNLYEHGSGQDIGPYDSVIGYAKNIHTNNTATQVTTIKYNESAVIPIKLTEMADNGPILGNLIKRPELDFAKMGEQSADCWGNNRITSNWADGVAIPIPEQFRFTDVHDLPVDNFVSVDSIYIIGIVLDSCVSAPISAEEALKIPSEANSIAIVSINSSSTTAFKLKEGDHYVIAYDEEEQANPYIVFADNSYKDAIKYGANVYCKIDARCVYAETEGATELIGTVLPIEANKAILVSEVWAMCNFDSPSITIFDPGIDEVGNKARLVAENLVYDVAPLIVTKEPQPIAFNGVLIDQVASIVDHDPTTTQDFEDTPYELVMAEMDEGTGMDITLSFLDEDGAIKLSETLYTYMNSGDGIDTTYVCGPEATPKLGGTGPSGGIVNGITYSYTDSGSYTISVNEGQRMGNISPITNVAMQKMSESTQARATIIQDLGNHIHFKVRVDGIGDRLALNLQKEILRVGDTVSVTIHNNPVEG